MGDALAAALNDVLQTAVPSAATVPSPATLVPKKGVSSPATLVSMKGVPIKASQEPICVSLDQTFDQTFEAKEIELPLVPPSPDKYLGDADEWSLQNENTNTTCFPLEWEDTCATNATNPSFFGDFEQARECQSDQSNASDEEEDSYELRCKSIPKHNIIRGSDYKTEAFKNTDILSGQWSLQSLQ